MKANAYSVACGGSVRVLKAGGRAARRVEDNISLWNDKREIVTLLCYKTDFIPLSYTDCLYKVLIKWRRCEYSTADKSKVKDNSLLLHMPHSKPATQYERHTLSLSTGSQLSALVMCLQNRTCEHSRLKNLLSRETWAKAREYRE